MLKSPIRNEERSLLHSCVLTTELRYPVIPFRQNAANRLEDGHSSSQQRHKYLPRGPDRGEPFRACEIRPILEEIPHPFLVNIGRPMSTEDVRQCEVHEELAQPGRVEHICVEEGPECRHESDPDLLVIGCQFVEDGEAFRVDSPFVGYQGLEANTAMGSDLPVLDLACVEQLDE